MDYNHAHVYMKGVGPFSQSVERVEHVEKLFEYPADNKVITLYQGKMFNRTMTRWYVLAGVSVTPPMTPFNPDNIMWAGAW